MVQTIMIFQLYKCCDARNDAITAAAGHQIKNRLAQLIQRRTKFKHTYLFAFVVLILTL